MFIIFFVSILLSFSLFIETFGFLLRAVGKQSNAISFGYSAHVQIATLSRIGTFIGLPIVAYLIDRNIDNVRILILPIFTFGIYTLLSLVVIRKQDFAIKLSYYFFNKIIAFSRVDIIKRYYQKSEEITNDILQSAEIARIKKFGILSFFFTSGAFFVSSIFAQHFHLYRATILQLTPFISFLGTLSSVVYFDPKISHLIDCNKNPFPIIFEVFKIRLLGAILLIISFSLSFFIINH